MSQDIVTATGVVGSEVRHLTTAEGYQITSFRLASRSRRYDRKQQKWVDNEANWFSVVCFREMAANVKASIEKGHRVVVTGRLKIRDWSRNDRSGTSVEIEADAIGHDLFWGRTAFTPRQPNQGGAAPVGPAPAPESAQASESAPGLAAAPAPPVHAPGWGMPVEPPEGFEARAV